MSISLPEDLLKKIDEATTRMRTSRSEFIAGALEEKLGVAEEIDAHEFPTVLWRLKSSGYLRARSPKYPGRSVGKWVVEEVPVE